MQEALERQHEQEEQRRLAGRGLRAQDRASAALREFRGKRYIDLSKDTQFTDVWIILAIILTLAGLATGSRFLTTAALCLLVIPLAGWVWNAFALFGVDYTRKLSETRAFLGETVELTLEVRNRKWLPLAWLHVLDLFPPGLPVEGQQVRLNVLTNQGEFLSFWNPGVFGRLTRRFTIHCTHRGYYSYGPAVLTTGDGFGMFSRKGTLALRQQLIVYPRLYSAEELGLPAKNPFGERAADARLVEDPLRTAGIRDWEPSDGLKRVHWKATARHQALLSRVYEPSQEPQVLIFLNVATLERHWLGHIPDLMERAVSVAGSVAALCSDLRLPVGLIANGVLPGSDQPLRLLPSRSPEQLVHILELLAAVTAFASRPIEALLLHEAPRLPWGSTLLVVTAIAHEGLLGALQELQQAGRRVVLFTLAAEPPREMLTGIRVYHMPHLVNDAIAAARIQ
jgi:uncharacterized protein (DUF58 family)